MLSDAHKGIQAMIFEHILGERPSELLEQIKEKLAPEDQRLLWEYDEEWIKQINRQDEIIYTQALMRGIAIGYWTALIGRGVREIEV